MGGGTRPLGSRVDADFAIEDGVNFLNDATRRAVAHRVANPQLHQTLDATRLYSDLLSSMPMCFNLFGPLWDDPELCAAAAHRWFPVICPAEARATVTFEWSPGRRDPTWLGDRTAFDAVLHVEHEGQTTLIGIETKYHEYPITEAVTRVSRGAAVTRSPRPRYIVVTERAGLFASHNWIDEIWGTDLEQIWRDHMLALACMQASADITAARYVLVAPAMNPPWADLADRYSTMLTPETRVTFAYRSLESLLDQVADLVPHAHDFRNRYLAVEM
ncbi:MAG: hypothetical protein JWN62_3456 [Acidimicrobiales bacterium]|nr:hypothetical protein [Acidimicrobiales bacterium]